MPLQSTVTASKGQGGVFGWVFSDRDETMSFLGSTADPVAYVVQLDSGPRSETHSTGGRPPTQVVYLREIVYAGRRFRLKRRLWIKVASEDGVWYAENPTLGIIAYGDSVADALDSFQEDFSVLWEEIAQAEDHELTVEARRVKAFLREIVEAVEAQ